MAARTLTEIEKKVVADRHWARLRTALAKNQRSRDSYDAQWAEFLKSNRPDSESSSVRMKYMEFFKCVDKKQREMNIQAISYLHFKCALHSSSNEFLNSLWTYYLQKGFLTYKQTSSIVNKFIPRDDSYRG